ncbi:hypothetical protein DTL42_17845 [Bremerella cremea]|uniref:Uncharacterized protein n=1 Tax=Bremerella cremea TaxID=1031537 RepID=A0A368KNJ7_9BACT|nr:hypothetical protein [Bremerella cremea]RCS44776.1 hypothetical protein DTL42_17845 [Bremerella cremea]
MTTSTWDYENQVTQVENYQGDVVTYTYGIVTQKTDQKRVSKDDGAEEIRYRWGADNIAQETDDVGTVVADYTLQPEAWMLRKPVRRLPMAVYLSILSSRQANTLMSIEFYRNCLAAIPTTSRFQHGS